MNKLVQITKIALLTIILAEEVRKATRKTKVQFGESNEILTKINHELIDSLLKP